MEIERRHRHMNEKSVSLRITAAEFEALKILAKKDVRTISSWIRAKIVSESHKAGISIGTDDSPTNNTGGEKKPNLDPEDDSVFKD
jgi:hypothetical protein